MLNSRMEIWDISYVACINNWDVSDVASVKKNVFNTDDEEIDEEQLEERNHVWMKLCLLILCRILQYYSKCIDKSPHCKEGNVDMFPSSSVGKRKSTGSGYLRDDHKRRKSGASSLKDEIKILLNSMSLIAASYSASSGSSIEECMSMIHSMEGIAKGSPFYCYVCNFLCDKGARTIFVSVKDATVRLKWLMYNYEIWRTKNPGMP
ncbi:uncharacterized protein Fot_27069 [Forsythia ovata]|uniref:Uncharacterized protein n=1 Tax=Forsythia ovata TaxID=205694 RepID=A0ABD1UDT5_9LAMI